MILLIFNSGGSKEICCFKDISKFQQATGCSSVMLCRAAEWNASIFRTDGKLDLEDVIKAYIKLAVDTNTPFTNTKYTIQNMLRDQQETPFGKLFLATQTMEEICELWDLKDHYVAKFKNGSIDLYRSWSKTKLISNGTGSDGDDHLPSSKRKKLDNNSENCEVSKNAIVVPGCIFIRGHYQTNEELPKSMLLKWARDNRMKVMPSYETKCSDKRFRSVVVVGEKQFMTDLWEKNKKQAEQAAAMACVKAMKIASFNKTS